MKRLLLVLPLIASTPALADTPPSSGSNWYLIYSQHYSNSVRAFAREDLKTSCSELRMAQAILEANFVTIKLIQPGYWIDVLSKNKSDLESYCTPKGL